MTKDGTCCKHFRFAVRRLSGDENPKENATLGSRDPGSVFFVKKWENINVLFDEFCGGELRVNQEPRLKFPGMTAWKFIKTGIYNAHMVFEPEERKKRDAIYQTPFGRILVWVQHRDNGNVRSRMRIST